MSAIKIVKVPPGFAPPEIRKEWVGVSIPLPTAEEVAQDPPSDMGIGNENTGGVYVLRTAAIDALKKAGKKKAADFWEDIPLGRYLLFKKEVCSHLK